MNPNLIDEPQLRVVNTKVTTNSSSLFWTELVFLIVTIVLGATLYFRSRQPRHLLIVLAAPLFALAALLHPRRSLFTCPL